MGAKKTAAVSETKAQEVCVDLPGQRVQCWRSSDKVKVILRKHRDVIFDINITKDATYTVESKSEFYSPREKKLLKKASFFNGEKFQIWVGREFRELLVLKVDDAVMGQYQVNELDPTNYGDDPKEKPEPLLIALGTREYSSLICKIPDPLSVTQKQLDIFSVLNPKLPLLKSVSATLRLFISPRATGGQRVRSGSRSAA